MPLLNDEEAVDFEESIKEQIPDWIFEYDQLGYQKTKIGAFVYRLPTLKECRQYRVAYLYSPHKACRLFLDRILLVGKERLGKLTGAQVGMLILAIVKDHFPQGEETLEDIEEEAADGGYNLFKVLDTYVRAIAPSIDIWEMNIEEVKRISVLAHMMLAQGANNGTQGGGQSRPKTSRETPEAFARRREIARRMSAEGNAALTGRGLS